jgi:hypothetical protein
MTMRRVLVLAVLALLLPRPCAASDPTPLIALVVGVPAVLLSVLVLALASFAPRAGFFVSLVLLVFVGVSIGSLGGMLLYLALAINAIAFVVSLVRISKRPEETAQGPAPGRRRS